MSTKALTRGRTDHFTAFINCLHVHISTTLRNFFSNFTFNSVVNNIFLLTLPDVACTVNVNRELVSTIVRLACACDIMANNK